MNEVLANAKEDAVEIFVGTYGDKWVAATGRAPYFCIQADSSKELDAKIDRLIAFAKRGLAHVRATRERDEPTAFTFKKKIVVKELEFA